MTAAVGFPTLRLIRVRIGDIFLDDLQPGQVIKTESFRPGVTCFACGEEGHYAKQCPKPRNSALKPNNSGNNSAPKRNNFNPNNNHKKGHVNHVTKEEA
jgi:hypothetical protein